MKTLMIRSGSVICCALFGVASFSQSDSRALSLLMRVLENENKATYSAVKRVSHWESQNAMQIRQDKGGQNSNFIIVLSPLSKAGEMSFDDGKEWRRYVPDQKTVFIQTLSGRRNDPNVLRLQENLLKENYRVNFAGRETIAGRQAVVLRLTPNEKEALFSRRFWVDSEKNIMLRVEINDPAGRSQIVSDTIKIDFDNVNDGASQFKPVGKPKEIRLPVPNIARNISEVERSLGFTILIPVQMPYGFMLREISSVPSEWRKMAVLRFTDGVSSATIYQGNASAEKKAWKMNPRKGDFVLDGVMITVDGDIPDVARRKIIEVMKASGVEREKSLRQRASEITGIRLSHVNSLRDVGLGFNEVITLLTACRGNNNEAERCYKLLQEGRNYFDVLRTLKTNDNEIKRAQERFWNEKVE